MHCPRPLTSPSLARLAFRHALLAAALLSASPAFADILPEGWTWRRPLTFKEARSDAPGDNLAWAEFYANGAQRPDAADYRVTTANRQLVPFKLMQSSKDDDFVRIAFATRGDGPYFVWWGNPKAEKPAGKELDIRRGIYLEVSRNQARPALALDPGAPAGAFLASYFVNEMALGYNPFGDDRNVMLHFSGQFKIDRPLKPQMAFTVSDLGALQLDGKELDRERGGGGLRGRVRNPLSLELAPGWHTIDVRQVNQNQANVAMSVAWQRPGEANYSILPGPIFAPVARAAPGALEKVNSPFSIDFSAEPAAEGFIPPSSYVQRYTFDAQYPSTMHPSLTWDFGDGQVLSGLKHINHIYLAPGIYTVTLKVASSEGGGGGGGGGGELKMSARLTIKDRMYARFPRPPEDPPRAIGAVLKEYDPNKLSPAQALSGCLFFDSTGDTDNMLGWGKSWLNADEKTPLTAQEESTLKEQTTDLANVLLNRRQGKDAALLYQAAADKPAQLTTRAKLLRMEVVTLCDDADDPDAALKEAQSWIKKIETGALSRTAPGEALLQSALAYAAIAKGDGKLARTAIDAALHLRDGGAPPTLAAINQRDIRQGVLTRNVENYIRTKEFDAATDLINQWEEEFPESLWDGFTRILRVKLANAQGNYQVAARIALAHSRANPDGFYAAELLYRAAENFRQAGQQAQAKTAMDLLTSKYPESPYARGAPAPGG